MKISYNWLREYVDVNISPEKLAELLTMHSFEVENIIYQGEGLDGVVVGEVLEIKKHPDADRLNLVKVDVGDFGGLASTLEAKPPKSAILDIVCGAPNVKIGQKVAVALIGTELLNGMKIEKRKVRGVESCGMICAEDELGLGENHEGIMILNKDLKNGTPIKKALNLDDTIFEIDILPNRAHDCLSHIGVAREIAVLLGKELKNNCHSERPQGTKNPVTMHEKFKNGIATSSCGTPRNDRALKVKIENKELCRRYSAIVINDIEVKDSPAWLKNKLESCDVRPINNIVDITNYVMLSLGQPMHAFDVDKINSKFQIPNSKQITNSKSKTAGIIVRQAKKGESILALDDKTYKLNEDDLVIADENKPIAIAGVMGGLETAVDENTKNIIFESANFQGAGIRKTSQRLKLASESSYRFEREIDPELTMRAIETAVKLAGDLAGGKAEKGMVDIYPNPVKPKEIEFDFSRVENLLGIKIEKEKVVKILNSLEFITAISSTGASEGSRLPKETGNKLKIKVPTYRIDVEKVNDIIEEIGRIYGYKNIPEIAPEIKIKSVINDKGLLLEKDIREISEGLGWSEVYNYSFVSEKDINSIKLDIKNHFELENPLSEEYQFMRTSLLSGLLKNTGLNLKYKNSFELFELGRVYLKNESVLVGDRHACPLQEPWQNLPDEKRIFAGVVADKNIKDTLFYELKGKIEVLLSKLGIGGLSFQEIKSTESFWHKGRSAEILYGSKLIGRVGEIHPIVSNSFEVEERILYFEIYQNELVKYYNQEKTYKQINRFPNIELDLSVVFDEDVNWSDVKKSILNVDNKLIKSVEPFDIYRGKGLGENKKSIAFRISYQAEDRTLKDEEVGVVQEKIIKAIEKLGGEIRN